ncbi:unnamed protein product [Ectocarpus sp. CCAP 1310/34]|nr:unnamed protein product [Ectocarpus sp. CCAP 1310/34]
MPRVPRPQQRPRGPSNRLHAAAECGSFEATATVLASGAFDIDQGNEYGWTALMLASRGGYARIVGMILNKGAQVSITNDHGATALHWSAMAGHLAVTKMLVEAGAPVEATTTQHLCTPLHYAADNGCAASVTTLLEAGANLNSRRSDGATPLYTAAWKGNVDAARLLLLAKADPLLTTVPDPSGRTFLPLDAAAENGHPEVVNELIRQVGIDGCGGSSGGVRALQQAAQFKNLNIMVILTNAGVVDTGLALVVAAGYGGETPLKFLLEQARARKTMDEAAYVNTRDRGGVTPLLWGIQHYRPRVVRLLVEAGADTTSPVAVRNQLGGDDVSITPLGLTMNPVRDKVKVVGRGPASPEQLHKLEAIRRLLLRVEAVHAVSWLWPSDISTITRAAARGTDRTTAISTAVTLPMLVTRRRARGRKVPLAALLRYSSKP